MKRDILDDYREFFEKNHKRMLFQLRPKCASIDGDGDVQHEWYIKLIIPGIGEARGGAVVWIPRGMFPHLEYDGECETELCFENDSCNNIDLNDDTELNQSPSMPSDCDVNDAWLDELILF